MTDENITDINAAREALKLQRTVLKIIAELVEFRDDITGGHIERTAEYLGISYSSTKKILAAYPDLIVFRFGRNVFTSKEKIQRYINHLPVK